MSIGKYSPTVTTAYRTDQKWWEKNGGGDANSYDVDGYDSYGYDENDLDRAGYSEFDYLSDGKWIDSDDQGEFVHDLYEMVLGSWGFKNGKPFNCHI